MCVCCMCVLRSEKMVCYSLTNADQLFGCSGISKGGCNRPGDGQPGFLSKMGMTIFKASHAVWEDGRYLCVCVNVANMCRLHLHNLTTNTHTSIRTRAYTKHTCTPAQNRFCHDQWPQSVDCPLKAAPIRGFCTASACSVEDGCVQSYNPQHCICDSDNTEPGR